MAGSIRAIDSSSVHQITSGQVITNLQTAVKELVENSLDAGATNIEVRFKEFGVLSFEVSDDGFGIEKKDYQGVALKGHTSKLSTYDDLASVGSFGFRGEALSSLCQLADVTITTATRTEAPIGTVLTFDRRGNLLSSNGKVARQPGTTITVSNLFGTIPVRRKEFERNAKKQFGQAQTLLQAYGLISMGTRISLSNTQGTKPPQNLFRTDGKTTRENYAILFSAKNALTLIDFDLTLEVEGDKRIMRLVNAANGTTKVSVKGLISKPANGSGRTSADRQFFYVNGRPFEAKSISRAFNEVYKSYVPTHYPSVIADFHLDTDSYDVNVSPDKRSILLHHEGNLIEALKTALDEVFQPYRSTYNLDSANLTRSSRQQASNAPSPTILSPEATLVAGDKASSAAANTDTRSASVTPVEGRSRSVTVASEDIDLAGTTPLFRSPSPAIPNQANPNATVIELDLEQSPEPELAETADARRPPKRSLSISQIQRPMQTTLSTEGASWRLRQIERADEAAATAKRAKKSHTSASQLQLAISHFRSFAATGVAVSEAAEEEEQERADGHHDDTPMEDSLSAHSGTSAGGSDDDGRTNRLSGGEGADGDDDEQDGPASRRTTKGQHGVDSTAEETSLDDDEEADVTLTDGAPQRIENDDEVIIVTDEQARRPPQTRRTTLQAQIDLAAIRRHLAPLRTAKALPDLSPTPASSFDELASAGIEQEAQEAHKALSRLVSKADFAEMEVIGQFNVAFIIARRRQHAATDAKNGVAQPHDDLMIIDQHASDEKYNFERLQQITKIDSQKLIIPRVLDLPSSEELLAIEHEEILRFNGFEIEVDEEAPVGQRIKLVAMPISKSTKKTEFTVEDLEELLFLLRDHTGSGMVRPSKTRKLFAMLACRSSIMVGKVLNPAQMTKVVKNMGQLDQPWNCPHGRNTMRWLYGLPPSISDSRFRPSLESLRALIDGV